MSGTSGPDLKPPATPTNVCARYTVIVVRYSGRRGLPPSSILRLAALASLRHFDNTCSLPLTSATTTCGKDVRYIRARTHTYTPLPPYHQKAVLPFLHDLICIASVQASCYFPPRGDLVPAGIGPHRAEERGSTSIRPCLLSLWTSKSKLSMRTTGGSAAGTLREGRALTACGGGVVRFKAWVETRMPHSRIRSG